ncbi:MAG TPA: SIMPL domain-containing protein [Methanotrichaceae archaeon]|nr:SIMPL domain-containing protein [Methanotrichaceae archaeon]
MRRLLVLLLGLILLAAASTNAAAQNNGTLRVVGAATVTVPADTVIIDVAAQSSNNNTTIAAAQAEDRLNIAEDALKASGVQKDEIMPGRSKGVASYISRTCREVNNTTICHDVVTKLATEQMEIRLKTRDQSRIDKVLNVSKASNVSAEIAGYALDDTSAALTEARKKAVDDARSNAEDYSSALGLKLGKVIQISEPSRPEIGMAMPFGMDRPFGMAPRMREGWPLWIDNPLEMGSGPEVIQSGMMDVTDYVVVTYEISS